MDADDDTPLAMLPAYTSAAKSAATPSEQTPSNSLRQTPQLTNPASTDEANAPTLLPASLPAQPISSTPAAPQSRQSEAALLSSMPAAEGPVRSPTGHHATDQEVVSVYTARKTAEMASLAKSHDPPVDHVNNHAIVPADATDNTGSVAQGIQADAQRAGQRAEDDQDDNAQAEGCIRQDGDVLHKPDAHTEDRPAKQHCLTSEPEPEAAVKMAISAAASSPQAVGNDNDLISDSESEDPPGTANPALTGSMPRGSISMTEFKQDTAAGSSEALGVSLLSLQHATQLPGKQYASAQATSNSQMVEGGSWQEEHHPQPSVLQQSSGMQPPVPLQHCIADCLHSSARLPPAVGAAPLPSSTPALPGAGAIATAGAIAPAALFSSADQNLQQPQEATEVSPAGAVAPEHGSSESLLHAEAKAARLAALLAPPVYSPPALAQQLEALGEELPVQHTDESPVQTPLKALPDAARPTSMVVTAEGQAAVTGTAAVSRQLELSGAKQHVKVQSDVPVVEADSKPGRQDKEDSVEQEGAKTVPSNGLQQLAVQLGRNRLSCSGNSELARPWPASGLEQQRALPQLQDAADLVIPDR